MKAPNAIPISTAEKIGDNDALDAVAACPLIVNNFKYISISSFSAYIIQQAENIVNTARTLHNRR